jgi:hypothetical protein
MALEGIVYKFQTNEQNSLFHIQHSIFVLCATERGETWML